MLKPATFHAYANGREQVDLAETTAVLHRELVYPVIQIIRLTSITSAVSTFSSNKKYILNETSLALSSSQSLALSYGDYYCSKAGN